MAVVSLQGERTIQRVYSHLMTLERTEQKKRFNSVGFSAGVKGEKKEEIFVEEKHFEILPFEFGEFAKALIEDVLKPAGKNRVIILCDEANQMPIFKQEEILERYFDLFALKNVQFLFVAGKVPWDSAPLPSRFETVHELKGFPDSSYLSELISKAGPLEINFSSEAIKYIYDSFSGCPRLTLDACIQSYEVGVTQKAELIDVNLAVSVVQEQARRLEEHKKKMSLRRNQQ